MHILLSRVLHEGSLFLSDDDVLLKLIFEFVSVFRLVFSCFTARGLEKRKNKNTKKHQIRLRAGAGPAPRPAYTTRRPAPPQRAPEFGVFFWLFFFP